MLSTNPQTISIQQQIDYALHLADTTLILAQCNAEWCAHGPILEQDIAITNITLDLIGQSRNFYQYAATLINETASTPVTEDSLAYWRDERAFKNLLLVEIPNGDWGRTVFRQFFFSVYQYLLLEKLQQGDDETLAAIAAKSIKETTYHVKWSSEWVIRLGDGTVDSHDRMEAALAAIWSYTGECFEAAEYETESHTRALKDAWMLQVKEVLGEATLTVPENVYMHTGGKNGIHTENLGFILAEMQYLQRSNPGAEW